MTNNQQDHQSTYIPAVVVQRVKPSIFVHPNPFAHSRSMKPASALLPGAIKKANEYFNYKPLPMEDNEIEGISDCCLAKRKHSVSESTDEVNVTFGNLDSKTTNSSRRGDSKSQKGKELFKFAEKHSSQLHGLKAILFSAQESFSIVSRSNVMLSFRAHKNILSLDLDETLIWSKTKGAPCTSLNYSQAFFNYIDGNTVDKRAVVFYSRPYLSYFLERASKMFDVIVYYLQGFYFFRKKVCRGYH